jgi:hypothetical protein
MLDQKNYEVNAVKNYTVNIVTVTLPRAGTTGTVITVANDLKL